MPQAGTRSGGYQGMVPVHGISWDDRKRRSVSAMATATALMLSAGALATTAHAAADTHLVSVIVRAQPAGTAAANQEITSLGGVVQQHISLINAIVAEVPAGSLAELEANPAVAQVTLNAPVQLQGDGWGTPNSYNPVTDVNSMYNIEQMDGAHAYWNAGFTGQNVGVALIELGRDPRRRPPDSRQGRQRP